MDVAVRKQLAISDSVTAWVLFTINRLSCCELQSQASHLAFIYFLQLGKTPAPMPAYKLYAHLKGTEQPQTTILRLANVDSMTVAQLADQLAIEF